MLENFYTTLHREVAKQVIGNHQAQKLLLTALLAEGHVLLEDDPGSGKTALSRALANSLGLHFQRVQATPDLLPSDLTGINIYRPDTKQFEFHAGPIFTEILLVDEINRATPRTQSALLEAMAERQVTADGQTRSLSELFFVIATQNPLETAGTFPLPEAQLDRFMLQFSLEKLQHQDKEQLISQALKEGLLLPPLSPVTDAQQILAIRQTVREVYFHPVLLDYLVSLCEEIPSLEGVVTGVSHRCLIQFAKACQAYAYLEKRQFVLPDDIQTLAVPILAHRLFFQNTYTTTSRKEELIGELLHKIQVPTEDWELKSV